jgi:hypothetical protein
LAISLDPSGSRQKNRDMFLHTFSTSCLRCLTFVCLLVIDYSVVNERNASRGLQTNFVGVTGLNRQDDRGLFKAWR